MSFFTGEFACKIDAKGRLTLPSKVKSKLPEVSGNQVVLILGMEPCIELYPMLEYQKVYSKVASMDRFDKESRKIRRNFFRRIVEMELDSAGRILIPKSMSEHAGLEKEVILVGTGKNMELWDAEKYEGYVIDDDTELSKLAQEHLTER